MADGGMPFSSSAHGAMATDSVGRLTSSAKVSGLINAPIIVFGGGGQAPASEHGPRCARDTSCRGAISDSGNRRRVHGEDVTENAKVQMMTHGSTR